MAYLEDLTPATIEALHQVNIAIHRQRIAELDAKRTLLAAANAGTKPEELARLPHFIRLSAIAAINEAQKVPPITEGFSGAGPYEICQRYAIGELTRNQLIDELTRWHYPPKARPEHELDDLLIDPPGTWAEVEDALSHMLIDGNLYDELMDLTDSAETQGADTLTTQPHQNHA